VVNLFAGVFLIPAVWSWQRRQVAERVRKRRIPDVMRQERIETARKQAMDLVSARRIGVTVDPETREITGSTDNALTAPHPLDPELGEQGRFAIGVVNHDTIRSVAQMIVDKSRVRGWVTPDSKFVILPNKAGWCRALLYAESGTGKTVLLASIILAAVMMGWKVVFIDAKGVPKDARELAELVRSLGATVKISGRGEAAETRWNLFHGTAEDVTAKLMRLQAPPSGANQFYLTEIEATLDAIQAKAPLRSIRDLQERIENLGKWVTDQYDYRMLRTVVDSKLGTTLAERAVVSVVQSVRKFQQWTDPDGWTFEDPGADVMVCPLIPVDPAQAALGDLLLMELRSHIKRRLDAEDFTPVLMLVDEFPQLVTPGNDPATLAAQLFETMRSAGGGLILASQTPEGLSPEEAMRARAQGSGAAIIFGRQKSPDELCALAGTDMRLEASGAATGEELRSGRAQHTYAIKPDDVREAADGQFWIIQGGAHATFRALPNAAAHTTATPTGTAAPADAQEDTHD
jgi:hypothetical protein